MANRGGMPYDPGAAPPPVNPLGPGNTDPWQGPIPASPQPLGPGNTDPWQGPIPASPQPMPNLAQPPTGGGGTMPAPNWPSGGGGGWPRDMPPVRAGGGPLGPGNTDPWQGPIPTPPVNTPMQGPQIGGMDPMDDLYGGRRPRGY